MPARDPSRELAKLRRFRALPQRDVAVAPALDAIVKQLKKQERALGGLDGRWPALVPPILAGACRPEKLTPGGQLTIRCANAAARYEMELWLRTGGDEALRKACKATVKRIKLV